MKQITLTLTAIPDPRPSDGEEGAERARGAVVAVPEAVSSRVVFPASPDSARDTDANPW